MVEKDRCLTVEDEVEEREELVGQEEFKNDIGSKEILEEAIQIKLLLENTKGMCSRQR